MSTGSGFMRYFRVMLIVFVFLLFSSGLTLALETESSLSTVFVFEHVNILPMTSEIVLYDYSVIVTDGKIQNIGRANNISIPKSATIINGSGKYLMPGLADMHTHIMAEDDMDLYLANGITMVRNMWGGPFHLELKRKIEQGEIQGPRVLTTGPLMDGYPPVWPGSTIILSTFQAKSLVGLYKQQGYDYIKVYDGLSENIYRAILKEAKAQKIPVVGHVPYKVGVKKAIMYGQKSFEHLFGYKSTPELYNLTVENEVWNCPTLIAFTSKKKALQEEPVEGMEYIPAERLKIWEIQQYNGNYEWAVFKTKKLHDVGAKLLAGTDANNPYIVPGFSMHEELERLTKIGFSPYETLKMSTVDAAEFAGLSELIGTVEIDKNAELILLNQNPLLNISNTRLLEGVMKNGEWINRTELDAKLIGIIEKNKIADEMNNLEGDYE